MKPDTKQSAGVFVLPEGYRLLREVDLQKDKKLAIWVNLAAIVIALAMVPAGVRFAPLSFTIRPDEGLWAAVRMPVMTLAAIILYMVAHELVHGFFIKRYCGKKARYGFTGLYAFAGREDAYFSAHAYRIIALAPVAVWGIVLAAACALAPVGWFWGPYVIQIVNISGAAGDLYVVWLLARIPGEVYVNDSGVSMRFYTKGSE